jgi:hypothetical protein
MRLVTFLAPAALLPALGGCVERMMQVESDPPGALVYLNGEEAGRTPMRKNFLWYGTYDVQLRKEGYRTLNKPTRVWAPWWQIPPIDLLAEIIPLPLQDSQVVRYKLEPVTEQQTAPAEIVERAVEMRSKLRSSRHTRKPAPTSGPATTQSVK